MEYIISLVGILILASAGYYLIRTNKKDEGAINMESTVFPEMVHAESVDFPESSRLIRISGEVTSQEGDISLVPEIVKVKRKKTTKKKAKSKKRKK